MGDDGKGADRDLRRVLEEVKSRLSFQNIYKQAKIVSYLNCNLEVTLKCLKRWDLLKTVGDSQITNMLANIPFLKRTQAQEGESKLPAWKLCYSYPQSVLIVTGISSLSLQHQLQKYTQTSSKTHKGEEKRRKAKAIVIHEGFFTMIDGETKENAQLLKGFLRSNKKYFQERRRADFKQENRRVRIVRFGEEDLFSFIIDIMTEYKAQMFTKSMEEELGLTVKQRSQPRARKAGQVFYKPFSIRSLQNNAYFWSSPRPQQQEAEAGEQSSEDWEEFYSITSLNSQADDSKNQDFSQIVDKFSQSTSLSLEQLLESEGSNNQ